MVWSWSWLVCWGWVWDWLVSWGWVWLVSLSFWVVWDTFVSYISDESVVVISGVGDSLDTAIGKVNLVRSVNGFTVSGFSGLEVGSRVIVSYSIFESVWLWGFVVFWGFAVSWSWGMVWGWGWSVVWSWGSSWDSSSTGYESRYNGKTEHDE